MSNIIYANARFAYNNKPLSWWQENNPVLANGEPGIVSDAINGEWLKIGDGVTAWNDLPWKKTTDIPCLTELKLIPNKRYYGTYIAVKDIIVQYKSPTDCIDAEKEDGDIVIGDTITPDTNGAYTADPGYESVNVQIAKGSLIILETDSVPGSYNIYITAYGSIRYRSGSYGSSYAQYMAHFVNAFHVDKDPDTGAYVEHTNIVHKAEDVVLTNPTKTDIKYDATSSNPQSGKAVAEGINNSVGDVNSVLAAIIEGSSVLPKSIINKVVEKAAAGVETKIGNRFVTAVSVMDTGSVEVEPNAAYCIISNSESGRIVVYDRNTEEPVEFTGKIIGMITGNYGDDNPQSVLGILGIYSSALITKGTYLALSESKTATFSWEGEATVITVRNVKGE